MMMTIGQRRYPKERFLLLALILFAYAWRLHGLTEESLWRDEVDAVYFALRDLPQTLSMFVSTAQNGALYFLSLRPWLQAVGSSEFALRYPSVLGGVLCIPLIWKVGQRLLFSYNSKGQEDLFLCKVAPIGAAALLAINPYQLWYSQEGKMYSIIVAQALLASWLWLRGVEADRQRGSWIYWLAYLVVTSLSIYSHLLMILMIPIHFLWFLIGWPQSKTSWRGYFSALAGLTLPYLPMLWWQWDMLTDSTKRTGYTFTPFDQMLETLLNNHTQGFMQSVETIWYAPLYFVALAGLLMGLWELRPKSGIAGQVDRNPGKGSSLRLGGKTEIEFIPDEFRLIPVAESSPSSAEGDPALASEINELQGWRRYLMLLVWLFGPILLIYGLSLRQPVFVDRYIIWIGPAGILTLMLGLSVVWHNAGSIAKPLVVALGLYICGFWIYAGLEQQALEIKYNLRSAVGTIKSYREADDLLILQIPHMEFSYRYYSSDLGSAPFANSTDRLGHWVGGLWTNNGLPDDQASNEVNQHMINITNGFETVWVLRSEVEMWDQRHLMDQWLDTHGQQIAVWNYHGSQVRQYKLSR